MPLSPRCSLETHRWSPVGWMTYKCTALYEWYCYTPSHITVTHFHAIRFTTTDHSQQVKPVMPFSLTLWSPRWHRGSISRMVPGSEPYVRRCIIIYINMQGSCSRAALGDLTPLRCKEHLESEAVDAARASVWLSKMSSALPLCGDASPPPRCSDIGPVSCLCVVSLNVALISIRGTQISVSPHSSSPPTDSALCFWLTSLFVQWSL